MQDGRLVHLTGDVRCALALLLRPSPCAQPNCELETVTVNCKLRSVTCNLELNCKLVVVVMRWYSVQCASVLAAADEEEVA